MRVMMVSDIQTSEATAVRIFTPGFTVMVKLLGVPVHPDALVGVTVMVAVIATEVLLMAVKLAILPVPLAASPIDGVLLVQL